MRRFIIFIALSAISFSASAQFPASSKIFCYMEVAKETVDTGVKEQINDPKYYFVMFGNDGKLAVDYDQRESFLSNIKKNNDYYREILTKKLNEFDSIKNNRASLLGKHNEYPDVWSPDGTFMAYRTYEFSSKYSNQNQVSYEESYLECTRYHAFNRFGKRIAFEDHGDTINNDEILIFNKSRSQMVILRLKKTGSDVRYYYEEIDMNLLLPEKKSYEVF